jgi:hypothetical protein
VFAALGTAAMVFTRHKDDGEEVTVLEWCAVGAATVSAMVAAGTAAFRTSDPISSQAIPGAHKLYAGTDLVMTAAQLVLAAIVFGFVMDRIGRSDDGAERKRLAPETFGGVAGFLDLSGTITSNIATLLPIAAVVPKGVLVIVTAGLKGGALTFKVLELAAVKKVLFG